MGRATLESATVHHRQWHRGAKARRPAREFISGELAQSRFPRVGIAERCDKPGTGSSTKGSGTLFFGAAAETKGAQYKLKGGTRRSDHFLRQNGEPSQGMQKMKLWFVAAACLAFSLSPLTMQCEQNFGCSFLNPATQYSGTPADVSTTSIRIVRANSATVEALVGV